MGVKNWGVSISLLKLFLFFVLTGPGNALYSPSSPVKTLGENFQNQVKNSDDVWLVEFFAEWCGHCKQFAPEYEKAARALKGVVKVGAVQEQSVISAEGVGGFPTVKLYLGKGNGVKDYNQARTAESVVDFVTRELSTLAKNRLNKKAGGAGGESKKSKQEKSSGQGSDVVVLTDDNFSELVGKDEKSVWFVEFYAPWCGHCKQLAPVWEELGTSLKNKVKVGKVDADANRQLVAEYGISGYPSLFLLPSGPKSASSAVRYSGGRDLDDLVTFALGYAGDAVKAAQLLNNEQFQENCTKGVCVIAFLPHLLDSGGAKGRKKYLEQLNGAVKSSVTSPVKFFWVEGGKNFDLEETLRLQFGWPALIATRVDKSKYAIHRGDFSSESIRQFIISLMAGKSPLSPLPEKLPAFSKTKEWDGEDLPPPKKETHDEEL